RRHTRSKRDWSSDVCSSDLAAAAALEILGGGLLLRARAATVLALSGARAPLTLHRADEEGTDLELDADEAHELPLALDPGDRLELGTVTEGLRLVLAVRGGLHGTGEAGPVLGSLSRDTLSGLGPAPLEAGDVLLVGPERGLDAVPTPVPDAAAGTGRPPTELEVPVHAGPRDALMGTSALDRL